MGIPMGICCLMQHAGLQYGQAAANSHQSPPFAHADISQTAGGNTTSSLRQFRKKDGTEKSSGTDLNASIETHIARVPPHNHFPARPNDYYRYQHQYPDYNSPYKETPAQVKYSEIAETQPIQHVDHIPAALQKHKEVHKDFMDMCNISQQTHMKQNYPDNLTRQQSYPPDASTVHHQYLHKEPQVHPGYKPESQYQQYPQIPKYNMPSQCRKYPPPPPENDFLAKLQRINPSMARSIMSDHHIRESQTTYSMDQSRMYPQNQRYYPPTHLQNNLSYNYQPYNYSSCNYKHPDYPRSNQMVGGTQYPALNPHSDRSISPRNLHMMNYGTSPQKISPNYSQYNAPEYAQHYQHRRASMPQDYYQQACRANPYIGAHQISPESSDNRGASGGGLRHFIENWAEEEGGTAEITPIFKDNIRIHNNESSNEPVFVISPSDIPQIENVSLVPTENGQYIIKSGSLDNSVVRIKETTESNGERTVNLQIVEATPKADCMLAEESGKNSTTEETPTVPYQENQITKDCDDVTKTTPAVVEEEKTEEEATQSEETSVIVTNEVSVIKDMPIIDEEHAKTEEPEKDEEKQPPEEEPNVEPDKEIEESRPTSPFKRTQRIFSVDDIINNIGSSPTQTRRNSLQLPPKETEETPEEVAPPPEKEEEEENEEESEDVEYRRAFTVEDDSVILEIGGALVQLNVSHLNGTKVLSVLSLSESLVIDVNGNVLDQPVEESIEAIEETLLNDEINEDKEELEDIGTDVYQSEVVIGEDSGDNDVFLDLTSVVEETPEPEPTPVVPEPEPEPTPVVPEPEPTPVVPEPEPTPVVPEPEEEAKKVETSKKRDDRKRSKDGDERRKSSGKRKESEERYKVKKTQKADDTKRSKSDTQKSSSERKKDFSPSKKMTDDKTKKDRKLTPQSSVEEDDAKKKPKKIEKKLVEQTSIEEKPETVSTTKEDLKKKVMDEVCAELTEMERGDESEEREQVNAKDEELKKEEEPTTPPPPLPPQAGPVGDEPSKPESTKNEEMPQSSTDIIEAPPKEEDKDVEKPVTKAAKKLYEGSSVPMKRIIKEAKTKSEDMKRSISKLEETVNKIKSLKEKSIKEEVRVRKTSLKEPYERKNPKVVKKVTFNLETEVREISKEEIDRKRLSWEEYNSRKRKPPPASDPEETKNKIMEDTVTSTEDINDEVVEIVTQSIENAMKDCALVTLKKSPPRMAPSNWEDDTPSPESPPKNEVMSTTNRKCIIDVNEFNIKPIESISTPSPVSSSQFSYHSEDDSLQIYKDVVDSKLNSLNINIPKITKPKSAVERFSVLFDRFLNKGSLNYDELEEVKKFIEIKRKMLEEKKLTYEVRGERDYKDLKLHFKKVPEKRKKKRFRNLYAEDSSDDSDSSRSEKGVGDYSVYQRDSQGVPKLIFKRKSGLPQPFVKLERSQAVELLAKKRKLY